MGSDHQQKQHEIQQDEALKFKEKGNELFKHNQYEDAIKSYTKSINLLKKNEQNPTANELAINYKNRAACHLKLQQYQKTIEDCDKCLNIIRNDPKALYRRCQAYELLEQYEEAYRDAMQIFKDNPNNGDIQPILERLHRIVQERLQQNSQIASKIDKMSAILFDRNNPENSNDKRLVAVQNLLVLARERCGSEFILKKTDILHKLQQLIKIDKNQQITINIIRILGELCKHTPQQTVEIIRTCGIPWLLELIDSNDEQQVNSSQYCIQIILNTLSGMDNRDETKKPNQQLCDLYKTEIDTILTCLCCSINNQALSGLGRDAIIELLTKNIHYDAFNWAERLIELNGVQRLLDCTSELHEFHYESSMNITKSTSTIASVCLARIYDNMYYDEAKTRFLQKIEDFIRDKLLQPDIESKIRCIVTITSLLRGPLDIGNTIISKEGIIEMILVMANTDDDLLQQKVACECLIAAASKQDKAKTIITQGVEILKRLYKASKDDGIRVRALVGLCKLGSSSGTDATMRPFRDGANLKLAEACRRFLLNPTKDQDIRKWACEGLSYLTLDAEVKEKLIEDAAALQSMIELAKTNDQSCLFGVITTLVNLCNAYEKQEIIPEMLELAKFAKQHIPEEHEFDDNDFVIKRICVLCRSGFTTALVALSKTESKNSRELIARVFNAFCSEQELRGIVVQQGGVKVLMHLSLNNTVKGKRHAAQALSRIAITINPEVAFPGQRSLEVIRPLVGLLHPDCSGLENFEALMGLCNIAQVDETARKRILKEGGLSKIEQYMYEDHQYLCRAAVQCLCNLTMSPEVVEVYEGTNDRIKFLISLILEDDVDTIMAASGALAILTNTSLKCCEKIFDSKNWLDAFHVLLANNSGSIQYRGLTIISNIIQSSKELTEKLIETDIMEILMALSKLPLDEQKKKIIDLATNSLQLAEKWGVIKRPNNEG